MKWWQPKSQSERSQERHRPASHAHSQGPDRSAPSSDIGERIERLNERTDALLRDAGIVRRESEMTTEAIKRDMRQRRGK
jgi:hypothetical protein